MNGVFHIGATGLHAQDRALEIVANNITNMNTPGFKRGQVRFSELVGPSRPSGAASAAPDGLAALYGVAAQGSERMFMPGEMRPTGNAMDLAIQGDGFIEMVGPQGQTLLWRGGTLRVGEDGFLAGPDGLALKSMIAIPEGTTNLSIDTAGEVRGQAPGDAGPVSLGRIELVLVRDMAALADVEGGFYRAAGDADIV